jgi:hypothetical protein
MFNLVDRAVSSGVVSPSKKSEPSGTTNLLDLPTEVISKIFEWLPFGTRRNVLPLVCRRFQDIVREQDMNTAVYIPDSSVQGGLTQRDLLRLFAGHRRRTVSSIVIEGGGGNDAWTGCSNVAGVILSIDLEDLRCFVMDGEFPFWNELQFVEAARGGRLRSLNHLALLLSDPLQCADLLDWVMPKLHTLELFVGADSDLFFAEPNTPRPFENMGKLQRVSIVWHSNVKPDHGDYHLCRFVDAVIPPSVNELYLNSLQPCEFSVHGFRSRFPNISLFGIKLSMITIGNEREIARDILFTFPNLARLIVRLPRQSPDNVANDLGCNLQRELGAAWTYRVTESVQEGRVFKSVEFDG